jgi:hypothetical protein
VQVGLATAEELTRQKEQLMLTEQRLDDINSTLRNSEKHIQVRLFAKSNATYCTYYINYFLSPLSTYDIILPANTYVAKENFFADFGKYRYSKCCGSVSGIRCLFDPGIRDG